MKRWERWTFGVLALLVALTGTVYFVMKYLMVNDDPFAIVNHPWQSTMLHAHVLASPPFLLMFGILLNGHIMRKLRVPKTANRRSGLASLWTFAAMVVSGYLLQVTTNETALSVLVTLHVASGTVFAGAYVGHLVVSLRLSRSWAAAREMA